MSGDEAVTLTTGGAFMAGSERQSEETHAMAAGTSANNTMDDYNGEGDMRSIEESDICRICFLSSYPDGLLSPCDCRGSIGLVHKKCLDQWMSQQNTDTCNICSRQFKEKDKDGSDELTTKAAMTRLERRPKDDSPLSAVAGGSACTTQDGSDNVEDSSSMSESGVCRICFNGSQDGSLLSPCNCRGTIGLVHGKCLEQWLLHCKSDECNICCHKFKVKRAPRSIMDWLRDPSSKVDELDTLIDVWLSIFSTVAPAVYARLSAVFNSDIAPVLGCLLIGVTVVLSGAAIYFAVRHFRKEHQNNFGAPMELPAGEPEDADLVDTMDISP